MNPYEPQSTNLQASESSNSKTAREKIRHFFSLPKRLSKTSLRTAIAVAVVMASYISGKIAIDSLMESDAAYGFFVYNPIGKLIYRLLKL